MRELAFIAAQAAIGLVAWLAGAVDTHWAILGFGVSLGLTAAWAAWQVPQRMLEAQRGDAAEQLAEIRRDMERHG